MALSVANAAVPSTPAAVEADAAKYPNVRLLNNGLACKQCRIDLLA